MNNFSGRRPNDRLNRIGKGLLEGLGALGTALADGPKRARIIEIDQAIADLQQERDHLIKDLIEPGEYVVSENYDPHWSKDTETVNRVSESRMGDHARLVKCEGRDTSSRYHKAHPGCPYIEQIHVAHEFTLRD